MTPPAPRRAGDEAAERIISLLWLLLSAPHGLERDRIRRQVVGYEGLTDTAFEKLFQRDRRVLRAVAVMPWPAILACCIGLAMVISILPLALFLFILFMAAKVVVGAFVIDGRRATAPGAPDYKE